MSVPNQKTIYIERSSESVRKDYLKISNDSLKQAMYNLSNSAFKLWIYFADNAHGYKMDIYPIDFITIAAVSRSTYDRAFNELLEKGYIQQSTKCKNLYMFHEISPTAAAPDTVNSVDKENLESIIENYF